ncbi:MAG: hypothetical protein AMXMBFR77_28700 [Phycisphaerales bacterium]
MAAAQEDVRLALEAGYAMRACANPAVIAASTGAQSAISESAAMLAGEVEAHRASVRAMQVDLGETEDARAGLGAARREALGRYQFVRAKAMDLLLNADPDEGPLSAEERARREKGLARTLGATASDLQPIATRGLIEKLGLVAAALGEEPLLKGLGLTPKLEPAVKALEQANEVAEREVGEDRGAFQALEDRRASLQRCLTAHRLWVEAPLVAAGRRDDLGRYVLAADPAYSARRTAGKPVTEEPGASEAASSLAPAATTDAAPPA